MFPTKASCAMSGDRSSRGTKRAPSKSVRGIRFADEVARSRALQTVVRDAVVSRSCQTTCQGSIRPSAAGKRMLRAARQNVQADAVEPANPADRADSSRQFGLPAGLFLGILSTSSGSARSISRRAIRSIKVAVVRPRRSASIAAVSTFWARPSRLPRNAMTVPYRRCEMKNPTFVAELHKRLGAPSSETVDSLRLLKAFLKLAPRQRFEVIELVERLATDALRSPDRPLS